MRWRSAFPGVTGIARSKFNARRVVRDGIKFDSKAEADRYAALLWLVKAGQISDVELQPVFELRVGNTLLGRYRGDFRYRVVATGEVVVEDVKGCRTPVYRWKRLHVAAEHGVVIAEVDVKHVHVKAVPVTAPIKRSQKRRTPL